MTAGCVPNGAALGGPEATDIPSDADRRRIRNARRSARSQLREIDAARDAAVAQAFRVELGAVVRSASPLLGPMLAGAGRTLDEMAERIAPPLGWPRRPRLSAHARVGKLSAHALRHYHAACFPRRPPPQSWAGCEIRRGNGDYIMVQAVEHSLELVAQIGRVRIETRFGSLRVEPVDPLPETILAASVGRLIEEIVDHAAWRGRGWRIAAIEDATVFAGATLVVAVGFIPYRMPWVR